MPSTHGFWIPSAQAPADFGAAGVVAAVDRASEPVWVVARDDQPVPRLGVGFGGQVSGTPIPGSHPVHALLPALFAERLGDRGFGEEHGARYAYVVGAMATGIASVELVSAAARHRLLAFFGAGGLRFDQVEAGIDRIVRNLADVPGAPWGANLIHSPDQPGLEDALVDLYLARGVTRIEASAFMSLAPSVVRYASTGLRCDPYGRIVRPNRVMAKISRPEVARHFLQPPPAAVLEALAARGTITADEARLAALLPVADDVTCEADSGGHTDRRPLSVLLPLIRRQRDELAPRGGWPRPVRVGAAGSIGDPSAVAAAFAMGADYVVTGTVNQLAKESGTSDAARAMLAVAGMADVTMAPAADMFEMGIEVQVLRRGTLFPQRARRLYELYREYDSLEALPADVRQRLEREVFRASFDDIWNECVRFWTVREPAQLERATRDPHHRMALVFRWYLGQSNRWAREGTPGRQQDYQMWCGPAVGAFNAWAAGTLLADPHERTVTAIAVNLLDGAVRLTRAHQLRTAGVPVPDEALAHSPLPVETYA